MKNKIVKVSILLITFLLGVITFYFFYFQKPLPKISKPENLAVEEVFDCKKPKNFPGISQELSSLKKDKNGYFPERIFSDGWDTNSIANWSSEFLEAMGADSLLNIKDENKEVYRFLWLRTFDHPVFIEVERDAYSFYLIGREFDGQGGYEPGKLSRKDEFSLGQDNWCEFMRLIEKSNFWNMKPTESESGLDGSYWIMEGVKDNHYHAVYRWTPRDGDFREACIFLLKLSGRNVDELKSDLY